MDLNKILCPQCGSNRIIVKGFIKNEGNLYHCKGCGDSFMLTLEDLNVRLKEYKKRIIIINDLIKVIEKGGE